MKRLDDDVDLLVRMAEVFLGDCPRVLGTLDVAIRPQDPRAVEHAAHCLKGAVANFSAADVAEAAGELERAGRNGDLTGAKDLRDALLPKLEVFRTELSRLVSGLVTARDDALASRTA